MSPQAPSTPPLSRRSPSSPAASPPRPVRDRDYLLDRHGVIFKVIGDVHPDGHYLGYVKYHPDDRGDRRLFDRRYRQNTVVSKSFGILADRPECYVYSPVLGCVITGLPRHDVVVHYSARAALAELAADPGRVHEARAGTDLLAIVAWIVERGHADLFGLTGSFMVGCHTARSDIDLVCYGTDGYAAATALFADRTVIRPYAGDDLTQLYLRRAKYLAGGSFDALIKAEARKFQGLTPGVSAHINCEPIRADDDHAFTRMYAKEIGEMTLLARITDHSQGLVTPALYGIRAQLILSATVDEPETFVDRITCLRSYLGAYTGAFREGDTVHLTGKLVHLQNGDHSTFGIELTPWNVSKSCLANLTG
jgi:predicted nucleotidyltransferase